MTQKLPHQHIVRYPGAVQNPRSTKTLTRYGIPRAWKLPTMGWGLSQPSFWSMLTFLLHMQKCFLLDMLGNKSYFPGGSEGKAPACNAADPGSIPGLGRSPGERNGNPLQYYCLENTMNGGAWWATVHSVAKSRTRLSDFIHLT